MLLTSFAQGTTGISCPKFCVGFDLCFAWLGCASDTKDSSVQGILFPL